MKKKNPSGPVADLYAAACKIVDGTRKVFTEHGHDARELRLPILIHNAGMRITIECGPKVAARNAIEEAQSKVTGRPVDPTVDMSAVINEAKALIAQYATECADKVEKADEGSECHLHNERIVNRCLLTAKGLFELERLV